MRPRRVWSDLFFFILLPEKIKKDSGKRSGGDGSHNCGGPKKQVHHPGEELWLADMDAEMNGTSCSSLVPRLFAWEGSCLLSPHKKPGHEANFAVTLSRNWLALAS